MSSGINLSGTDLFICFLLSQKSPHLWETTWKFTHHPAHGHKCIKHSILADILPHKLMPILLSECTRIHLLTPKNQKPDPPTRRGVPLPAPSPAPTEGRRGSDLWPLQQGRLLLCQRPLLLFFLLKTLLAFLCQSSPCLGGVTCFLKYLWNSCKLISRFGLCCLIFL